MFSKINGQILINDGTRITFFNLLQLREGLGRDILREILEGTAEILESVFGGLWNQDYNLEIL